MTTRSKALGSGLERRVVDWAKRYGFDARRQPGSGVYADFPSDVLIETPVARVLAECKVRSTHPSVNEMLGWLDGVQKHASRMPQGTTGVLVYNHKGSRKPKVILDLDAFLFLLAGY